MATNIWIYLSTNPLLWLTAILIVYSTAFQLYQRTNAKPSFNPVALAIPLYQQLSKLKKIWFSATITIIMGALVGVVSSIYIAKWLGADIQTQLSLAPKSVTAPVAMGIAEKINALPSLTAALVVTTRIIGTLTSTKLFKLLNIKDNSIKGIAISITAHGIGTARAFQVNTEMGAFSCLAMALSTFLISALLIPWLIQFLF